jgi:DNA-binding FadR family transcriptional regulator
MRIEDRIVVEKLESDLLQYIVESKKQPGEYLSSLDKLSAELNISTGKLREQLEVARSLGLVEVKPRTGIKLSPYDFFPAVRLSLLYALATDSSRFEEFSSLRDHLEFGYFEEAVSLLTPADHERLRDLVQAAWSKLDGSPIHIPHKEHRELHMTIYRRLENPFVQGVLEAYWEAYEAVGFSVLSEYNYLRKVWTYHEGIVDAIIEGNVAEAKKMLIEHTALRPHTEKKHAHANGNGVRRK